MPDEISEQERQRRIAKLQKKFAPDIEEIQNEREELAQGKVFMFEAAKDPYAIFCRLFVSASGGFICGGFLMIALSLNPFMEKIVHSIPGGLLIAACSAAIYFILAWMEGIVKLKIDRESLSCWDNGAKEWRSFEWGSIKELRVKRTTDTRHNKGWTYLEINPVHGERFDYNITPISSHTAQPIRLIAHMIGDKLTGH